MATTLKRIALDIDDVTADFTDAMRVWVNEVTGANLQPHHYAIEYEFWGHYAKVWADHGIAELVDYDKFHEAMSLDQSKVSVVRGAKEAIAQLKQKYDVVFITSRAPILLDETRRWLDKHIDASIPIYLANNPKVQSTPQSKGELCVELDVQLLIDDNYTNCQDAIDYGVEALLFGSYGWNAQAPKSLKRCNNWDEVLEYIDGRR